MAESGHKSAYIAFLGRPNVGKSTLLNHLVGQKVSITSRRPQTTRDCILGIKTRPDAQLIFVDTPGIHEADKPLNRHMLRLAQGALDYVDVVVFVIEAGGFDDEDQRALDMLREFSKPVLLVVNKIDKIKDKARLLPFLDAMGARFPFQEILPMSARQPRHIEHLENVLLRYLPEREALFNEDEITDRSMRFMAAEFIREQIFRSLGQEVPYGSAVSIEEYKEEGTLTRIHATIYVERDGQKTILIGKGGERLKLIGQHARVELEKMLGNKVYLNLWVKVKTGWSNDPKFLQSLGYQKDD